MNRKKNEIMKLKRATKLGLRLEDILKERIYRTGKKLLELQQERRKMEKRIIKLETKTSHKVKNSTNA
jgi:hypothetical protein